MGQITNATIKMIRDYAARGEHPPLTVHEIAQLATAWERGQPAASVDPTDPGHDVEVLREHVRHLERRIRQLHAANVMFTCGNGVRVCRHCGVGGGPA